MIVDTSAVIAILRGEPAAGRYIEALASADGARMSAGTYLESAIVTDANRDPVLSSRLDALLSEADVVIEAVTRGMPRSAGGPTVTLARAAATAPV